MKPRVHPIPEDWEPSSRVIEWAGEKHPLVDINVEAEKFLDYFLATGKCYANWDAAFRNWVRRAVDYNPSYRGVTTHGKHTSSNAIKLQSALNEQDAGRHAVNHSEERPQLRLVRRGN